MRRRAVGLAVVTALASLAWAAPSARAADLPDVPGQPVAFGDAGNYGSVAGMALNAPVVAMAATPDGRGYWEVASDGGVFAFGDAGFHGSMGATPLTRPVVGIAATPDGGGYWEVASDGGVFAFGDAGFYGSMGATPLAAPVVGIAATPDGGGYWETAADGGIFAFGDAPFRGSMGASHLNAPVVGIAATPDGGGYWEAAADGGIFAFGDAGFYGSMGATPLNAPVVGIAATRDGNGYWEVASDGGVFAVGDAAFLGSMGGQTLTNPVAGMAATPDSQGYWLLPTVPPPPPPPKSWAVPGTTIWNLDTAPGTPYQPGQKVVALTFDDGPSPTYTPEILQELVAAGVPASFSIIGENGAAYPYLLQQEVADGMVLVNHTWTHPDLVTLPASQWPAEVDATSQLLQGYTGHPPRCLRPPYGDTDSAVTAALGTRGLAELMWDVDPTDWALPGTNTIVQRVLGALHPGAIVIMHDGGGNRSETVAALPAIIAGIRAAGYQFVSVCGN